MTTNTFTHALLDFEGQIIKKYRWTKSEAQWYSDNHPTDTIVKLAQPIYQSDYQRSLELVGECKF